MLHKFLKCHRNFLNFTTALALESVSLDARNAASREFSLAYVRFIAFQTTSESVKAVCAHILNAAYYQPNAIYARDLIKGFMEIINNNFMA